MATKKDRCLHIDDIVKQVDKLIEETSIEEWMYVLRQSINSTIHSYWYEEMAKSYHRSEGKGWIYVGDASGITRNPNPSIICKQVNRVLKMLAEKKGVKL